MTDARLVRGDLAPGFTLISSEEQRVSLADFAGSPVILYFYPAAMTPGCTTQACDFRDNLGALQSAGYVVLGVSKDSPDTLRTFQERDHLTFPLLSDDDLTVHHAYRAYGEKNSYGRIVTGVIRSTFVIGEDGRIAEALYNVKATGHVASLRKRLGITG